MESTLSTLRIMWLAAFVGLLFVLFATTQEAHAEPPNWYFGPISKDDCFKDLVSCHEAASACGAANTFYTEQYNLMQEEKPTKKDPTGIAEIGHYDGDTICGDWDDTSYKVISDFFRPCYLHAWAQSATTPYASDPAKYGHYLDQDKKKWEIVNNHLAAGENKLIGPMTSDQACKRFFIDSGFNSAGSYNQPITKAQCEAKLDECAALYKKCGVADANNEFITEKTVMCTNKDKDGNFEPPFDVTQHCLYGLKTFGTGAPDQQFCSQIKTFALGKKCTCGGGDISNFASEGFEQTKGECCLACKTQKVQYGAEDVECSTASDLVRASGEALKVESGANCVGVNQSWLKYAGSGVQSDEHYYCNLCNQGAFLDKVAAVQVGAELKTVQCTNTLVDFSCEDGTQPTLLFPNSNEKILLKQVCTLCNTGSVQIKGASQTCTKEVALPAIKPIPNPVAATVGSPQDFVAVLIRSLLGIIGALALGLVVYGGLVWMTSAGNQQRIDAGRTTLLWAVIGLVAVFVSYVFVSFLFDKLG